MKIGIYGDSFATYYKNGWPKFIEEKLNAEIFLYAMGNSSIEWSYNTFLSTHTDHDMIIFVMSSPTRTSLITCEDDQLFYHQTSVRVHHTLDENIAYHKRKIYQECNELRPLKKSYNSYPPLTKGHKKYQKYTLELVNLYPSMYSIYHDAIRNSIKYLRPDAYIIEGFGHISTNMAGMTNITLDEINKLQPKGIMQEDNFDKRVNHMTFIQNREFADYLLIHIRDKSFDVHATLQKNNTAKYYTLSDTLEESGLVYK